MTTEETKHNTTKYAERGRDICPKCRSYENTQRHHDICQKGRPYYDYTTNKEGVITEHVI